MNLTKVSIQQTFGQIAIQTQNASQEMHSQAAELSIKQPPGTLEISSPSGDLNIDSSAAWAALGKGPNLDWMSMIYSQSKGIALQGIARIVAEGHRMAQITNPQNPFAEIAKRDYRAPNPVQYTTAPSYTNVRISYQPYPAEITGVPHSVELQASSPQLDVQYNPGSVDIYMKQQNSIDIQVSQYDWYK
ncbi:hypothetical protein A8990_11415 [Paenibacillus taihuensis]|uniref:Uncharacterized protein n=1 Tax=Paenibacillus taihuensis TaxID=1156355 RepID=A0A3D9S2U2_9BACL|nr:DUF6470 family protein [Paenibacillus taihuensis]REE84481.1 hypothetical protein A8990_11415 [Paenibacillus taihuensis]